MVAHLPNASVKPQLCWLVTVRWFKYDSSVDARLLPCEALRERQRAAAHDVGMECRDGRAVERRLEQVDALLDAGVLVGEAQGDPRPGDLLDDPGRGRLDLLHARGKRFERRQARLKTEALHQRQCQPALRRVQRLQRRLLQQRLYVLERSTDHAVHEAAKELLDALLIREPDRDAGVHRGSEAIRPCLADAGPPGLGGHARQGDHELVFDPDLGGDAGAGLERQHDGPGGAEQFSQRADLPREHVRPGDGDRGMNAAAAAERQRLARREALDMIAVGDEPRLDDVRQERLAGRLIRIVPPIVGEHDGQVGPTVQAQSRRHGGLPDRLDAGLGSQLEPRAVERDLRRQLPLRDLRALLLEDPVFVGIGRVVEHGHRELAPRVDGQTPLRPAKGQVGRESELDGGGVHRRGPDRRGRNQRPGFVQILELPACHAHLLETADEGLLRELGRQISRLAEPHERDQFPRDRPDVAFEHALDDEEHDQHDGPEQHLRLRHG